MISEGDLWQSGDLLAEVGGAEFRLGVAHGHGVGSGFADDENLFLSARDRGVDQVSLKHHEVRFEQRHDDDGVFRALAFVNADGVGEGEVAEGAAVEVVRLAVELRGQRAGLGVDGGDGADVTVEEVAVVVVAKLDDFVVGAEFAAG